MVIFGSIPKTVDFFQGIKNQGHFAILPEFSGNSLILVHTLLHNETRIIPQAQITQNFIQRFHAKTEYALLEIFGAGKI